MFLGVGVRETGDVARASALGGGGEDGVSVTGDDVAAAAGAADGEHTSHRQRGSCRQQ